MAITKKPAQAGKTVHTDNVNDTNNTSAGIGAGGELEASGAILEDDAKAKIDLSHESVDDNPRKDATVAMNQIDFNEPSGLVPPEEAVEKALKAND